MTGWDTIRLATSQDGLHWSVPSDALIPGGAFDLDSACDPTVVKFRGVYLMYYTCINTTASAVPRKDALLTGNVFLASRHCEQRIAPKGVVVVEILAPTSDAEAQ